MLQLLFCCGIIYKAYFSFTLFMSHRIYRFRVKRRMNMKLKDGFILREVAGQTIVLPSGDDMDLNMMITLNDTGRFLWKLLTEETDEPALVAALLGEYDVDKETAQIAVSAFIVKLNENGLLSN